MRYTKIHSFSFQTYTQEIDSFKQCTSDVKFGRTICNKSDTQFLIVYWLFLINLRAQHQPSRTFLSIQKLCMSSPHTRPARFTSILREQLPCCWHSQHPTSDCLCACEAVSCGTTLGDIARMPFSSHMTENGCHKI